MAATVLTVGSHDFDHGDVLSASEVADAAPVAGGTLDPDQLELTERAAPREQVAIAAPVGVERGGAQNLSAAVEHRSGVRVGMGVDAGDDKPAVTLASLSCALLSPFCWDASPAGTADSTQ